MHPATMRRRGTCIRALDTTQDYTKRENSFCAGCVGRENCSPFLRDHRHELSTTDSRRNWRRCIETLARQGAIPPALLAMIVLLQSYLGMSDAEAVELTVVDLRWQMVLDCLGADKPHVPGDTGGFSRRLHPHWTWIGGCWSGPSNWPGEPGFRLEKEAAERSPRGNRFQSAGRRGPRRRHHQSARHPPARSFCVWLDLLG